MTDAELAEISALLDAAERTDWDSLDWTNWVWHAKKQLVPFRRIVPHLLDLVASLKAELADRHQPMCRGQRHYFPGGYGRLCQCQRTEERR